MTGSSQLLIPHSLLVFAFPQKSPLTRVGKFFVRVGSCDFVDFPSLDGRNDPRNYTNQTRKPLALNRLLMQSCSSFIFLFEEPSSDSSRSNCALFLVPAPPSTPLLYATANSHQALSVLPARAILRGLQLQRLA